MAKLMVNEGKGLEITFDNGYSLSIQIGPGNYCDNRDASITQWIKVRAADCQFESSDAEIAVFKGDRWCKPSAPFSVLTGSDTDVAGCVPIGEVLDLINAIRSLPE